jgi:hypothetical protein
MEVSEDKAYENQAKDALIYGTWAWKVTRWAKLK